MVQEISLDSCGSTKMTVSSYDSSNTTIASYLYLNFKAKLENYKYFRITKVSIPNTWYPVSASMADNTIYFKENSGSLATAIIPDGFYTIDTLITQVQTIMNAASPNSRTYTITYNTTTNNFTITGSTGTFHFMFGSNTINSAYQVLGFNQVDTSLAASLISPNQPQLSPQNVIILKSNVLGGKLSEPGYINLVENTSLLMIPVNVSFLDVINYVYFGEVYYDINFNNLSFFDLYLTDYNNNIIDTRGVPVFYELEFK